MAFCSHIKTSMSKWYWVSKPNKFNLRSLFNNIWKHHSDWDFNLCVDLQAPIENYELNNLINGPTWYQSNNPTCTDLILTNKKDLFKLSDTFRTSLSNHHELISTILKSGGFKVKPKEKIYGPYRQFSTEGFKKGLKFRLNHVSSSFYDDFKTTFLKELNRQSALKKKTLRHNNTRFMTKVLRPILTGKNTNISEFFVWIS